MAVPTISDMGLAIMCGALVGVGILIIRRYTKNCFIQDPA